MQCATSQNEVSARRVAPPRERKTALGATRCMFGETALGCMATLASYGAVASAAPSEPHTKIYVASCAKRERSSVMSGDNEVACKFNKLPTLNSCDGTNFNYKLRENVLP